MKKKLLSLAVVAMLLLLPAAAFARGGHHGGRRATESAGTRYAVCAVEGCDAIGRHKHDGQWYCSPDGAGYYSGGRCRCR